VLDEAQYWTWSRALDFGYFSKPPMIAWVIRGASALCGDGEACVRSASPVLYTAASIMLYFTGRALRSARRLLVSHHLRHAAGRFLLLSPHHHRRALDPVVERHALRPG
jgi:4-amino-4-deoxy-L-arabinose transferase-like glycosyltransferase